MNGRAATDDDQIAVQGGVQKALGERGYMFAKKGEAARERGYNSHADEELVYTAVAAALRTGHQSVILTKDEDLLDQFYRLIYMVDTHYRSMYIADAYRDNFGSFPSRAMPSEDAWGEYFEGNANVLIERDVELPSHVLPSSFSFVAVSCWLVGDKYQKISFGAEQEMNKLLHVKGRTRGKNTEVLGMRNCHLSFPGMSEPWPGAPTCFAIAQDRTLPVAGQNIPVIEFAQAVGVVETVQRIAETSLAVPPSLRHPFGR